MTTASYKISDRLYLNSFDIPKTNAKTSSVELASNHILVIDCSGSMGGELPRIREQLKKKLPKMLKEKDTVSIVWFSGKGEFGTLIEAEPVATLADLKAVNTAIDRWLKPIGLTGFKEPLDEVAALTARVAKKYPGNGFSLFFMSDGADNCWSQAEVLQAVDKAAGGLSASAFVEYGYYANRPLLTAMAERAGGSLLFSGDFDKYEANLTDVLARRVPGGKRIEVMLPTTDFVGGIAYALADGDITTYAIDAGKVQVSEGVDKIWFLSPLAVGDDEEFNNIGADPLAQLGDKAAGSTTEQQFGPATSAAYAAVSLFATRMKPEVVKPVLKATGDVALIESYTNCFGKQAYSTFMEVAKQAAFGKGRWTKGYDPNKVPRDDAFTVLDMLKLLASDDENRVLMAHPSFKYSKIGRSRVDSNTVLTADEQAEIDVLTQKLAGIKNPKEAAKISAAISAIANKPEALKFEEDKAEAEAGYSVSNLVYNSDRPNVSLQVRKTGAVSLASRKDKPTSVPLSFNTFIFRNYTVIKDGLVNVEVLPVKLSKSTADALLKLHKDGLIPDNTISGAKGKLVAEGLELTEAILNFAALPVVNGNMVKNVSAKALFEAEYAMTKAKAAQKVYNAFKKEKQPEGKKSEGFESQYGAAAAAWLKEQGFTDFSGFSPKSVQAESTDFYMAKELSVSLKGLSSLPALKDVQKKLSEKGAKLTASQGLMAPYITEVEDFVKSKKNMDDKDFIAWVDTKAKDQTAVVRKAMYEMAQTKFAIILGQIWPVEFKSLDEDTLTIKVDGQEIEAKLSMTESKQTI